MGSKVSEEKSATVQMVIYLSELRSLKQRTLGGEEDWPFIQQLAMGSLETAVYVVGTIFEVGALAIQA